MESLEVRRSMESEKVSTSKLGRTPFVSVVTPVYNGGAHIEQCIESVLSQTYANWEYVIVNNCSTDSTLQIAERYAEADPRIRIVNNATFLSLLANWNETMRAIAENSDYVKVVHADDLLLEECIEKMVCIAERHPSVGIVGSYVRKGNRIVGGAFPFPDEFRDGREVARETLRKHYYVFGSPTSTLLRADLVRQKIRFYNEDNFHADVEACFELLRHWDLGFVHQVLTFTRMHALSQTSTVADRMNSNLLVNQLGMLARYGPEFLAEEELSKLTERALVRYYRELARHIHRFADADFRSYQRTTLQQLGLRLQPSKLMRALALLAALNLASPITLLQKLFARAGHHAPR